jgi:hypothetical protein
MENNPKDDFIKNPKSEIQRSFGKIYFFNTGKGVINKKMIGLYVTTIFMWGCFGLCIHIM